jgi:hypothetical protein
MLARVLLRRGSSKRSCGSAFMRGRPVERRECFAPCAWQFLETPRVELFEQLSDGVVELGEREEDAIAQTRENPAPRDEHTRFDFGLAFGLVGRAGMIATP